MDNADIDNNMIQSFELLSKPNNPFEDELNHDELNDTPKLGEELEVENEDPIQEFFSPQKQEESKNVTHQSKEPIKKSLDFKEAASDVQKSDAKQLLCGKKRKHKKVPAPKMKGSPISKDGQTSKSPSTKKEGMILRNSS